MKRILISLAGATAVLFAASGIIGNTSHGWRNVAGAITWYGFLLCATALVVTIVVALVRSRFGRTAAVSAFLLLAVAGVAAAAPKTTHVQLSIYSANVAMKDMPILVQATGAIRAIGTAVAKDDTKSTTVPLTLHFRNGTIFMKSVDPFRWLPDLASCTATEHSVGTWAFTGGTGAYRGITGHGTFVEHGAGIGVRAHGACQQKFSLNYVVATAAGTAVTRS